MLQYLQHPSPVLDWQAHVDEALPSELYQSFRFCQASSRSQSVRGMEPNSRHRKNSEQLVPSRSYPTPKPERQRVGRTVEAPATFWTIIRLLACSDLSAMICSRAHTQNQINAARTVAGAGSAGECATSNTLQSFFGLKF